MYERFTDRARKVMQLTNQEAQRFNHEYIGTEHILLGLVREGSGVAANVLKNLDVDLRKIRLEVEKLLQSGPDMVTMGKLPQTPRAKKVIEYAIEEARNLGHDYVGTEHILLGLLREDMGVAAQILMNLGLRLENVRVEILETFSRADLGINLGLRLENVRAKILATLQRAEDEGSGAYSAQSRIRWGGDETKCHKDQSDCEIKNGRRSRPRLILAAFLWAMVMSFILPALAAPRFGRPRQPIEFQVITTFITAFALFGLARSVSGWRHLLVAPLWVILVFMEYLAWIWPNKPW
jgi:hypothetical protein